MGLVVAKPVLGSVRTAKVIVPVAEQAGLNLTLSETPKTGFVATRSILR